MPASLARSIIAYDSSGPVLPPNIMQPRHSTLTCIPVRPSCRYSIVALLTQCLQQRFDQLSYTVQTPWHPASLVPRDFGAIVDCRLGLAEIKAMNTRIFLLRIERFFVLRTKNVR